MSHKYTAKLYIGDEEIEDKSGENLDDLYSWLLSQAEDKFGNAHGKIIDNQSNQVVREFRKAPPD